MSPAEDLGHPRNRWRVGHQAFLVVIQAMLLALTRFERAMVSNARDDARGALELSAILFRGAGAALRLAGDFDRDAYEAVIRPSMAGAHPQFSGLMNSDHRALIVKLRGLRAFFENMPESLARTKNSSWPNASASKHTSTSASSSRPMAPASASTMARAKRRWTY